MRSNIVETWRFKASDEAMYRHFKMEGFAVVENLLSDVSVQHSLNSIDEISTTGAAHVRGAGAYAMRNLLQSVPAIGEMAKAPALRAVVEPLLGPRAFPVKGILFDKTPDANWKVMWHQDTTICVRARVDTPGFGPWTIKDGVVNVQPPVEVLSGILTIRLHLDDCEADDGALQVLPGSHKAGRLDAVAISEWRKRVPPVLCTVGRGGAILMRPLILHASSAARSPKHRRVVHLEFSVGALPGALAWAV